MTFVPQRPKKKYHRPRVFLNHPYYQFNTIVPRCPRRWASFVICEEYYHLIWQRKTYRKFWVKK